MSAGAPRRSVRLRLLTYVKALPPRFSEDVLVERENVAGR
jgi:hypothetical protein